MPDKNLTQGMVCWLKSNLYGNDVIDRMLGSDERHVTVVGLDEYDEQWGQRWKIATAEGECVVSEHDLSPIPELKLEENCRGGLRGFRDLYGSGCSIQDSSLATDDAIWLGVDEGAHFNQKTSKESWARLHPNMAQSTGGRMHLSRGQVAALLPLLQHFVDTGMLPDPEDV